MVKGSLAAKRIWCITKPRSRCVVLQSINIGIHSAGGRSTIARSSDVLSTPQQGHTPLKKVKNVQISQGSVVTHLRRDRIFYDCYIQHNLENLVVIEFFKNRLTFD